jgi:HTH-type transcriptional regulator / antitoxin MqsA
MMTARSCGSCGVPRMKRFGDETFSVQYAGLSETVKGLNGWRCGACDDVEFDPASARKYASAGDRLVLRTREIERSEIRRIRRKLGLTQTAAARLTGGGHNAFSRYERGEAVPLPAVVNLFKLLDKHPNLLKDLLAS